MRLGILTHFPPAKTYIHLAIPYIKRGWGLPPISGHTDKQTLVSSSLSQVLTQSVTWVFNQQSLKIFKKKVTWTTHRDTLFFHSINSIFMFNYGGVIGHLEMTDIYSRMCADGMEILYPCILGAGSSLDSVLTGCSCTQHPPASASQTLGVIHTLRPSEDSSVHLTPRGNCE